MLCDGIPVEAIQNLTGLENKREVGVTVLGGKYLKPSVIMC